MELTEALKRTLFNIIRRTEHNPDADTREIIAAIETASYVVVPREPTEAMVLAADAAGSKASARSVSREIYRAALSAAPKLE